MTKIKMYTIADDAPMSLYSVVLVYEKLGVTEAEIDNISALEVGQTFTFKGRQPLASVKRVR